MRTTRLVLALVAITAALTGCVSSTERSWWIPDTWSYPARKDDPVVLEVPRPVAVDVESFNGNIEITCNRDLTEATVTVTREATHGHTRGAEARDSLDEIECSVRVVPSVDGPTLEIRAWTIHPEPHFQRAHLEVQLPSASNIRVRTNRGTVTVTDVGGAVDIKTNEGDVRVITGILAHSPVRIVNRFGDVDYRVRAGSSGDFDCEAVRGVVDYRLSTGRVAIHQGTDHDTLRASLNGGGNPVVLRTVDGDIRVAVVEKPAAVGAKIVTP